MSRIYLELDSTYRNRNQYPYPSDFVALVCQSGNHNALSAVDPVSGAAPLSIVFTPFTTFSGTVVPYPSPPGSSGIVLQVGIGAASKIKNYYTGLVLKFNEGTNNIYKSVFTWTYLYTSGGFDFFSVAFKDGSVGITSPGAVTFQAVDPTVLTDPNHIVMFVPNSPSVVNYYTSFYLFNQTKNEWLTIDSFDGTNNFLIATPHPSDVYSGAWQLTDSYLIRNEIPIQYGNNVAALPAPTASSVTLANNFGAQLGSFVRIVPTNNMSRIVGINGNTVTVSPGFAITPIVGQKYEILQFSQDNQSGIVYNFNDATVSTAVCYKVTLLNLVLPNSSLLEGGRAIYYPYLYVELTAINSSEGRGSNMIASNNPNATRMLFRVLVSDSSNEIVSPVVRLDGSGMVQHIKVKPGDSFHMSVHLPNGKLFLTEMQDNYSPSAPNPLVQISALFHFERINV